MGEVYRARDTRLDRTVAIKVLPAHLSASAQARERFEREARAISSLSHPHICPLYDVGHQDGTDFLVMEYLEGETLADRLKKGRLPLEQVLQYAIQIADALDAAHSHGVIHRDLKPGNIMLTKSGAKLLDFGLAKAHAAEAAAGMSSGSTKTTPLTGEGTILGTLQYMAPEQLEGAQVDTRTDLFALGAVIYEMATGKRAFEGKSQASLIAAILERDPPPVSTVQALCPPTLDQVVQRCLAKSPDARWQTARDLSFALRWVTQGVSAGPVLSSGSAPRMRVIERLAWVAGAILLALLAGWAVTRLYSPPQERAVRFELTVPVVHPDRIVPIVSPDGEYVAIAARLEANKSTIFLHPLNSISMKPLAGTEGSVGLTAFWSQDSKELAFSSESGLKRISIAGGDAHTICNLPAFGKGDWNRDGEILFTPGLDQPLYRVSASGGEPRPATKLDLSRQEVVHLLPQFLPDGRHFLYWAQSKNPENAGTYLASLDSPVVKRIRIGGELATFSPPGYLIFRLGSHLLAQSFDIRHATLAGDPMSVTDTLGNTNFFSVSSNGVLAYYSEPRVSTRLIWLDRNGRRLGTLGDVQHYTNPAISPDQQKVAVGIRDAQTGTRDIWIIDVQRGTNFRLTTDPADDQNPTWSPDGSKIAFSSDRRVKGDIYLRAANGGGADELLVETGEYNYVEDWSGDGQLLLGNASAVHEKLFSFPDRKLAPLTSGKFIEEQGRFCPNGSAKPLWFAYTSNETGVRQVYVQSLAGALAGRGARSQISNSGGVEPSWRGDGKELFYLNGNKLMAVDVNGAGEAFQAGVPKELFEAPLVTEYRRRNRYDVTRDGKRFLVIAPADDKQEQQITVIVNWPALLKH
jgi:serine/threonine protein kinase